MDSAVRVLAFARTTAVVGATLPTSRSKC